MFYIQCRLRDSREGFPPSYGREHLGSEGLLVQGRAGRKELTWAMTPGADRHVCFLLDLRLHEHRGMSCSFLLPPRSLRGLSECLLNKASTE